MSNFVTLVLLIAAFGLIGFLIYKTRRGARRSPMMPSDSANARVARPGPSVTQADELEARTWEAAIAAADAGRSDEAVASFRKAIAINPDYYMGHVEPTSAQARACWKIAVAAYIREANANAIGATEEAVPGRCCKCGTDFGKNWAYPFEKLTMGDIVGAQCPACGSYYCRKDIPSGDRYSKTCPSCGGALLTLEDGQASSSMVDDARRRGKYRGHTKEPSFLRRNVDIDY